MSGAIWIYAASGLTITGCQIESPQPTAEFGTEAGQGSPLAGAIFVGADPHPPGAANPGQPENFSGTLAIFNNDIDAGAAAGSLNLGVVMFSVGRSPDKEVDIYFSGNNIRNVTEPAINFRLVGGRAHAERNVLTTGDVLGGAVNPDVIRVADSGVYLIAHNTIVCGWPEGDATGINVIGQPPPTVPATNVVIIGNDVTMSAPDGTVFPANSTAIQVRGFTQGNSVLNNIIHGHARAALAADVQNGGMPGNTSFVSNDLTDFQSTLSDIFVDVGVTNTIVIGRQAGVEDHGSDTVVVPMP